MSLSRIVELPKRCFVAIPISSLWRTKVAELLESLSKLDTCRGVRWSRAEKLHITLCFLGDTKASQIPSLSGALHEVCRQHQAFRISAKGLGVFPGIRSPKVLWISILSQCEALDDLARSVKGVCLRYSESLDNRPFRAHLTIGRARGLVAADDLKAMEEETRPFVLSDDLVDSVSLVGSELGPRGSRYTLLQRFALSANGESSAIR